LACDMGLVRCLLDFVLSSSTWICLCKKIHWRWINYDFWCVLAMVGVMTFGLLNYLTSKER
jgi:hypothetical protein